MWKQFIALLAFFFCLSLIFLSWQDHLELKKAHEGRPTVATVYGKTARQNLFAGSYYYALMKPGLENRVTTQLNVGEKARLTKEQFDKLNVGDAIAGYDIHGTFYSQQDLNDEYLSSYIVLALFSIYPLGYIIYLLMRIKKLENFVAGLLRLLKWPLVGIFAGGMMLALYFLNPILGNTFGKIFGTNLIETTAHVHDAEADIHLGRHKESHYYLALSYRDQEGETIYLTKEVTKHTYDMYKNGVLPIKYRAEDPYHVYTKHTDFQDVIDILLSNTLLIYYGVFFIIAMVVFTFYLRYKRKNASS